MPNNLKLSYTDGNIISGIDAKCCSEGVPLSVKLENTVFGQKYLIKYESIGPGNAVFEKNNTVVYSNTDSFLDISNIVSLSGSNLFLIKISVVLLDIDNIPVSTIEDIISVGCDADPPPRNTPTPTPTITPTVTSTVTNTPSITPTLSNTATKFVTPTPTTTTTNTTTPSYTPTNTPTNTVTPSITPTISLTPSITPTSTVTPSPSPSRGLPKVYFEAVRSGDCLDTEQVLYADLRGLLPQIPYSYEVQKSNSFIVVPTRGNFTSDTSNHRLKFYVSTNSLSQCNISYITLNIFEQGKLIGTKTIQLSCTGGIIAPTPTPRPAIDTSNARTFGCGEIIVPSKLVGYNQDSYRINTGLIEECYINLKYRFFSIPEKLTVYTSNDNLLYDTGFVGDVSKDPDTLDYIFCPSIEREAHTNFDSIGPYSTIRIRKPYGSTYIKLYSTKSCSSESEWEITSTCEEIVLPTPNPTKCPSGGDSPDPNVTPSPTPTLTPTPTTSSVCRYNLIGSVNCDSISVQNTNEFLSVDKTVSAILDGDRIYIGGSSTCIDSSYDISFTKIALAKLSSDDGSLDTLFGLNGKRTSIAYYNSQVLHNKLSKTLLQSVDARNKKIISISDNKYGFIITRFNVLGGVDSSFGVAGQRIITEINGIKLLESKDGIITQDRKILIIGEGFDTANNTRVLTIIRLTENGNIDTSFGSNGLSFVTTKFGNASSRLFNIHYSSVDNCMYIVGDAYSSVTKTNIIVIKVDTSGIDTSYGESGVLYITDIGSSSDIGLLSSKISGDSLIIFYHSNDRSNVKSIKIKDGSVTQTAVAVLTDAKSLDKGTSIVVGNKILLGLNIFNTDIPNTNITDNSLINLKTLIDGNGGALSIINVGNGNQNVERLSLKKLANTTSFILLTYDASTNSFDRVSLPINKFNNLNEYSYVTDILQNNDNIYLCGYTGSSYDYNFAISKVTDSGISYTLNNSFNNGKSLEISFENICNIDQYNIPDPGANDGECPCLVSTPTPTPSTRGKFLNISDISFLCNGTVPTMRVFWSNYGLDGTYIIEILKGDTQLLANNLIVDKTSGSFDFDLSSISNTDIGKTCQIKITDTAVLSNIIDSKLIVLNKTSC